MKVNMVEGLLFLDDTPVSIEISNGKISKIIQKTFLDDPSLANVYVAPGLIDNQVNGYVAIDFSSPGLTIEGIRKTTYALQKVGVTTYLPTVITSSFERLVENFSVLAKATNEPGIKNSIPGFHLEGPYISPVEGYCGAHDKRWIRPPVWEEFQKINQAAEHKIIQVTLAPEIKGAIEFIKKGVQQGIIIALGHHNGSAEEIKRAIDASAKISTHLGNGCANEIHRFDNPLWTQLADDRLKASIICDGFHLPQEIVQTFFKAKGAERLILTSDVTKFAGMPPGEYDFYGKNIVLTAEGCLKIPSQNVFAGSASPITKGVSNIMRFTNCSMADAINMATKNPAKLYGFEDRGEIEPGKRADLILFTMENGKMSIKKTIIGGEVVFAENDHTKNVGN